MRTDTLFYQIFQTLPGSFFELIGLSAAEGDSYQFQSVEIKETAKRIDGLFVPNVAEDKPLYFGEVQFQADKDFYYRFFTEIFLYLGQNKCNTDWRGVVIYPRRSLEPAVPIPYQWLIQSRHVLRVYLDELGEAANQSLGVGMVKLIVAGETSAAEQVRVLIEQAQQQMVDEASRRTVIELIETILFYKFPRLTREEIEAMFGFSDLKQTRFYQEAKEEGREEGREEGKLESVPSLLQLGLTVEQIAGALQLDVETVKKAAKNVTG